MKNYHLFPLLFIFATVFYLAKATNNNKDVAISGADEPAGFDLESDGLDCEDWGIDIDGISIEDINNVADPSWWNRLKTRLKVVSVFLKLKTEYALEGLSSRWNSLEKNTFSPNKIDAHVRKHKKKYGAGVVCLGTGLIVLILYSKRSK